jgi:hypothetical protein
MPFPSNTLPRGTAASGTSGPYWQSPSSSSGNRARSNRARTAANARARARGASSPGIHSRSLSNLRNARAAQNPVTAPAPPTPATPTAPIGLGIPAAGAGATGGAGATASIWTATPASAPLATGIGAALAAGAGLAIGNGIYEDVLGRPWGPSLGDYFFPPQPQRDGSSEPYLAPGNDGMVGGQSPLVYYRFRFTFTGFFRGENRGFTMTDIATGPIGRLAGGLGRGGVYYEFPAYYGTRNMVGNGGGESNWTGVSGRLEILGRVDGQPDTGGSLPPSPQPAPSSSPYRPTPSPLPDGRPAPDLTPAAPLAPSPTPAPATEPSPTPYPEQRPDADAAPSFPPFPLPIPGRAPTPTPPPGLGSPPTPTAPPPSSRQGNRCPCSSVVVGGVGQQLNPIAQAQQVGNATAVGQGASLAAILARLQQMQTFAETAWKNTKLDKLINLLTLVAVLHNAAMLSRSVGETIGELASNMLATVGVKDETGNQLDINELVGTSVRDFMQTIVGEEVYTDVSTAWKKASRIVSSAAMIAYTVRSLHDTSKDVMEWTAENTGKIGNALKRWGVVGERAYPWMSERVKAQDAYRLKFQRFTDGLESLEDTASSLSQVTGNVREIQEEYTELKEQKDAFKALVTDVLPDDIATSAPESVPIANTETQATAASQSADVAIADAQKSTTP